MTRIRVATLGLLTASCLAWALPAAARDATKTPTVRVEATEFAFALSTKTIHRGTVTFLVANNGRRSHDFKIAGRHTAVLGPGETAKLTVTFTKAGTYAYYCTVAGHAVAGMKGALRIT